jgi:hypothetical protein
MAINAADFRGESLTLRVKKITDNDLGALGSQDSSILRSDSTCATGY